MLDYIERIYKLLVDTSKLPIYSIASITSKRVIMFISQLADFKLLQLLASEVERRDTLLATHWLVGLLVSNLAVYHSC